MLAERTQPLARRAEKILETRLVFLARFRTARSDVHGEHQRHVLPRTRLQRIAMYVQVLAQLRGRIDKRRGEDRESEASGDRERIRTVGGETNRRMRFLHRPGNDLKVLRVKIFSLVGEAFIRPRETDYGEGLLEALAAFFLWDVVADVVDRRGSAADAEFEPPMAQDVGGGRLLGHLDGAVQRQERDCCAEPDTLGALRCGAKNHQRACENRGTAAEVQFAEPHCVEAQFVAELDLGEDILDTLTFGLRVRARQLIEKSESHRLLPGGDVAGCTYQSSAPADASIVPGVRVASVDSRGSRRYADQASSAIGFFASITSRSSTTLPSGSRP